MSNKPSRNAPCPCGSGKKYKKCCLAEDEATAASVAVSERAVARALAWLREHYPDEVGRAVALEYLGSLEQEQFEALESLPEDLGEAVQLNAFEWMLAEGEISPTGDEDDFVPVMELVLGEGGPLMEANERRYLQLLASERIDLYEVVKTEPGEGLWLVSTLAEEPAEFWVRERSASRSLREGDIFGARALPLEPSVLSGALYPFNRSQYLALRARILDGPEGAGGPLDAEWVSACVIEAWLSALVGPPPVVIDASTGESMLLTTVHYRVNDWSRLETAFDSEPDVEREDETHWVRLEPSSADANVGRPLCSITKTSDERVELFAPTHAGADAAESWFSKLMGDAVERIARESTDPTHSWNERHARLREEPGPERSSTDDIPKEAQTAIVEQVYRQTYANWADEPIPALKNKTPRQAIRSKAGRRDVVELLRSYQHGEREQSEAQGRKPVDLGFMWEELGISDER
jgi:hypothetical protein